MNFLIIGYSNGIPDEKSDHEMILLTDGLNEEEQKEEILPLDLC